MEKKKIALIIDAEGWAFDNVAHQIKKNLDYYDIDIIPGRIFEGNMIKLFLFCQDYDLIHFIWRGYLSLIDRDAMREYAESLGNTLDEFKQKYIYNKKISFSVCDQLYLDGEDEWRTKEVMKYSDKYFVTSKKLYDIYNKFEYKPEMIIHDGVDLRSYVPINLERFNDVDIVHVGWVGNSRFKGSDNDYDMKGVEGIIKPAIKELQEEGYNIELNLADRNIKMIEQKDMPKFYNSLELYVCASKSEGTPLTILEAMAMGIPVISTDVGIVREAFGSLQQKYILNERSKECLKAKIKELLNNKEEFRKLSQENLEKIKDWDWQKIAEEYKKFFEKIINI